MQRPTARPLCQEQTTNMRARFSWPRQGEPTFPEERSAPKSASRRNAWSGGCDWNCSPARGDLQRRTPQPFRQRISQTRARHIGVSGGLKSFRAGSCRELRPGNGEKNSVSRHRVDFVAAMPGGEGGIRTHGTGKGTPHFECGAFDHSATSPEPSGGSPRGARRARAEPTHRAPAAQAQAFSRRRAGSRRRPRRRAACRRAGRPPRRRPPACRPRLRRA